MNKYSYVELKEGVDIQMSIDSVFVHGCETASEHEQIVTKILKNMPDDTKLYDLAELFKVFGDSTRIRMLYVLSEHEMCVLDIARVLGMTQSAISHQLKILKQARLVKFRREGKQIFYMLDDDHVKDIISEGLEHINE